MWAQGLTIGLLIVAGALTHGQRLIRAEEVRENYFYRHLILTQLHSVSMITLGKI